MYPNNNTVIYPNNYTVFYPNKNTIIYPNNTVIYPNNITVIYHDKNTVLYPNISNELFPNDLHCQHSRYCVWYTPSKDRQEKGHAVPTACGEDIEVPGRLEGTGSAGSHRAGGRRQGEASDGPGTKSVEGCFRSELLALV